MLELHFDGGHEGPGSEGQQVEIKGNNDYSTRKARQRVAMEVISAVQIGPIFRALGVLLIQYSQKSSHPQGRRGGGVLTQALVLEFVVNFVRSFLDDLMRFVYDFTKAGENGDSRRVK